MAVLLKGGPRGYLTNLYIDYPAWFRVMCTVGELTFGGSLSRNRRGGSEESIKPLRLPSDSPQTPPSYPRTSKLVISHFLREAVRLRIPATDTFDIADADTC